MNANSIAILLPLLLACSMRPAGASEPQAPNIVLIYADDLGYTDVACYGSELHLTPNIDALAGGGMRFTNAQIGKWHLGEDPLTQGFDINVAGNLAGHPKSYFSPYKNANLEDGEDGEYLTDRLTDESIRFIEQHRETPFFLYLSHYAVHTPIQAKPELKQFYAKRNETGNKGYAAMVDSLDQSVGRIIKCLDDLGLREQTVVIFTSDNGGLGSVTSMAPLRGSKGMLYEGGIREPFIVNWPGHVSAGTLESTPVIGTDLFPTFAKLAEAEIPATKLLDGVDISGLFLEREEILSRALFWHFPAYLEGNKVVGDFRTRPVGAVLSGRYKLLEFFEDGRLELYDLANDLSESHNLATQLPDQTSALHALMKNWRAATEAPMPTAKPQDG